MSSRVVRYLHADVSIEIYDLTKVFAHLRLVGINRAYDLEPVFGQRIFRGFTADCPDAKDYRLDPVGAQTTPALRFIIEATLVG